MRLTLSRRTLLVVAGIVLTALVVVAITIGSVIRRHVADEAARRHLEVQVGTVRVGWFVVRLLDVGVSAPGVDAVHLHLDEVRARLSPSLHVDAIEVHGGDVALNGDAERLRQQWSTWRDQARPSETASAGAVATPVMGDTLAVHWTEDGQTSRAELRDVGFSRDDRGLRLAAGSGTVHAKTGAFEVTDAAIQLDHKGAITRAQAGSLVLDWTPPHFSRESPDASPPESSASHPSNPQLLAARAVAPRSRSASPPHSEAQDPSTPFAQFPDLHRLRREVALLVSRLAEHVPEGTEASIEALTWRIAPEAEERRVAFTIGPGPFSFLRTPSRLELRFSTDTRAPSTSLSARVLLPIDGGDVQATLEGGPVSLSLLGIHEGAAGLVDVDKSTVTGTARINLAGDGSSLTFDAKLGTRGLSLHEPQLALDVVRGVDLDLRANGALSDSGDLRFDDLAATLGSLHIAGSGSFDQKPDHVAGSLRFELPSTACQSLLDSVPTALLPALTGTKMSGTFGARGHFAFDTRRLDDIDLEYDIQDECRMVEVPRTLARERFTQPFTHRVYLPDGSTTEQTTGPGSGNWTPIGSISPYMQVAVMTTEDGGFLHHRGFNRPAIRASIIANLKARRFVRGASTITMQLAKNLFLSRDKTLARKLEEVVLTDYLEQTFSKDELMGLYLNVIEFGPAVYGITAAAEYYFGRSPSELDLAEALFLSSLLPAPLRYSSMRDLPQAPESWMRTLRYLMQIANKRGLVTDAELEEGQGETIVFWHGGPRPGARPAARLRSRLEGNDEHDDPAAPSPDSPADLR